MAAVSLLLAGGCKQGPELPMQILHVDTESLIVPAIGAEYSVTVTSNTAWTADLSGVDWIRLSVSEGTGNAGITITVLENDRESERSISLPLTAKNDASVASCINILQAGPDADGYISVSALRAMEKVGETITLDTDSSIKGFVASSAIDGNWQSGCFAMQDRFDAPRCGITVAWPDAVSLEKGSEVSVSLRNAVLGRSELGLLTLTLPEGAAVESLETTRISLTPCEVSYDHLLSGDYESMYVVTEQVQVVENQIGASYGDNLMMENDGGLSFLMLVLEDASFADYSVMEGAGTVSGLAAVYGGTPVVCPTTENDIVLSENRMGIMPGIRTLPYIFSFYASEQNNKATKYVTVKDGAYESGKTVMDGGFVVTDNDKAIGATLTAKVYAGKSGHFRLTHWADNGVHDNIPGKSFVCTESMLVDGLTFNDETYYLLTVPLRMTLPQKFNVTFGLGGTGGALRNWILSYSSDNQIWYEAGRVEVPSAISSSGFYHYFTVPVDSQVTFEDQGTLYIKISPYGNIACNGKNATGISSDVRLHSCIAIHTEPVAVTSRPADVVYFEPFDGLKGGLDYLWGDRLAAMMNYCGSDISQWTEAEKNGLSGENVRQRPGYAQLSYVESQAVKRADYVNNLGWLETPQLGQAGDLELSFKAMAYLTPGKRTGAKASEPADVKGDLTAVTVEVIGGGTIDGKTKVTVEGLSTYQFDEFRLDIKGATAATKIRFSSDAETQTTAVAAADRIFSRWFIDDITITK